MDKYKNIATVLYVEDEDGVRRGFSKALSRYAKTVYEASNGREGLELYKKHSPDIVVTDIKMPKMDGIEMSKAIKEIDSKQAIIITSAHSESSYLLESIRLQISGYILKPVDKNILKEKVLEMVKAQQMQKELDESITLMQEISSLQHHMLVVFDENNKIIFVNQMFLELFDVESIEHFVKKQRSMCNVFLENENYFVCDTDTSSFWTDEFENLSDDRKITSIMDVKTKEEKAFLVNIKKIDSTAHKICTFTEVTTLATRKKELEIKAYVDELTKICNRAKFNEALIQEILHCKASKENLSIIFFDIDHFKNFNDKYGHQTGDEILQELAEVVGSALRDTDVFARWGGEEFVILLPKADKATAAIIADSKRKIIENYVSKSGLRLTCSFGVASMSEEDDKDSLLKKADDNLYKAKNSGRNCVVSD